MGEKKKAQSIVTTKFEVDMSEVPTYDEQLTLMNKKLEAQRKSIEKQLNQLVMNCDAIAEGGKG